MKRHQISLEEICDGVYENEHIIASSSNDSKQLASRVSISLSGDTMVRFIVRDMSMTISHRIVMITYDVNMAIARYNSL